MEKKIIVLGAKGMLGQMVVSYFSNLAYSITEFNQRITEENIFDTIRELNAFDNSVIINCIGKIKQKTDDAYTLLWSNSILPMELSRSLKAGHFLIQPSTDCVFSGETKESYKVDQFNDAEDIYGWSKSLGELALQHRPNTLIIRVSIIGPDQNSNKGLLGWFLSQENGISLNGYTNHLWNGITTLEWCKFVEEYLNANQQEKFPKNTIQLGTKEIHSKYEMLKMFNKCFQKEIEVNPVAIGAEVNKTLVPDYICKPLLAQLIDLNNLRN